MPSLRNVGLVAHVDAGKTTTTEQLMYLTGRTRAPGSVDEGTAQTDWLDVERERGISVRMATTVLPWRGSAINLVDTPGHVDFVAEVERAFQVLDGAVLIISGAEGVQAHTETLWHALRAQRIPTLLFINKMDRLGASGERVLAEIAELTDRALPLQAPVGAEEQFSGVAALDSERLTDRLAELDEPTLERYVTQGAVDEAFLRERIASLTRAGELFPVLFGSAKKGLGIRELLDGMVDLLPPPPSARPGDPVAGVVFKLDRDPALGRIAYVRLYSGQIENRDAIRNAVQGSEHKVSQIRKMYARHHEDVGVLPAGDIAALAGLGPVRVGDIVGDAERVPGRPRLAVPVLSVRVHPAKEADYPRLVAAMQELTDEDPLLEMQWVPEVRELLIKVTGAIQVEVLQSLLASRFGLTVRFDPPSVIYQETPTAAGEGYVAYTMPKPCWAILRFAIAPGPRGSGLRYASQVGADSLLPNYQREVERRVPEALRQGLLGWQVTDLSVTLTYGEHHIYHTHPLDFVVATPMGIMDGLTKTGTTLLEPLYAFRLSVPEELAGRVLGDLIQLRARMDTPAVTGGRLLLEGEMPVATSLDYPVRLAALTSGKGILSTRFAGYQPAPPDVHAERQRIGVDPRDRAKYILSVRGAL